MPQEHDGAATRAYSYLRFSSPDQQYGDSVRRQVALAAAYALEFNLVLDDTLTYQDFGISGFRGQNAASGRLGDFLAAISSGLVSKGSLLLVENLDRLSRDSALHAQNLLTQIVLSGVSVVTLSDRRTYSVEELRRDPMGLIFALINFIRANEESEIKSSRAKANWVAKRETALTRPLTARCPGWLQLDKITNRFSEIPERADIVRLIFDLVDERQSFTQIAKTLNHRKILPWTGKGVWNRHAITHIVGFSAVVGTYVPHHHTYENGRMVRRSFKPIPNYYPAVVSVKQFERAHHIRLASYTTGRSIVGYLLQSLAVCDICGHFMQIVRRTDDGPGMACAAAIAGTVGHYTEIPYLPIDQALRDGLPEILRCHMLPAEEPGHNNRLRLAQNALDRARREHAHASQCAAERGASELTLRDLKIAEEDMMEAVESYESRAFLPLRRKMATAAECLAEPDFGQKEARLINVALRGMFTKAIINQEKGRVELHQENGRMKFVIYRFDTPA